MTDLINTGAIDVYSDHSIKRDDDTVTIKAKQHRHQLESVWEFKQFMQEQVGWKIPLESINGHPASKVIEQAQTFSELVLFSSYLPPSQACEIDGISYLHALDFSSGISSLQQPFVDNHNQSQSEIIANQTVLAESKTSAFKVLATDNATFTAISPAFSGGIKRTEIQYPQQVGQRINWQYIY